MTKEKRSNATLLAFLIIGAVYLIADLSEPARTITAVIVLSVACTLVLIYLFTGKRADKSLKIVGWMVLVVMVAACGIALWMFFPKFLMFAVLGGSVTLWFHLIISDAVASGVRKGRKSCD